MMEMAIEKPEEKIPVVLWLSRHEPLESQVDVLSEKLGEYRLIKYDKALANAEEAVRLATMWDADYIIPVLPMSFIMHLVKEAKKFGYTVLYAEMRNMHNCISENCPDFDPYTDTVMVSRDVTTGKKIYRHFRFLRFVKLVDVKLVTEEWV